MVRLTFFIINIWLKLIKNYYLFQHWVSDRKQLIQTGSFKLEVNLGLNIVITCGGERESGESHWVCFELIQF